MAASDIRVKTSLPEHPKTKRLIRRCGQAGAWNLIRLFLFAAANHSDGDLSGMDDEDIEVAADWQGEPGAFVTALVEVRFLAGGPLHYAIHDWAEHNPWAVGATRRAAKASFNAIKRHHGLSYAVETLPEYAASIGLAPCDDASSNASSIKCDASSNAPSPSPSPSPSPRSRSRANAAQLTPRVADHPRRSNADAPTPEPNPKPPPKPQPKPKRSPRQPSATISLPDWIPADAWAAWIEVRTKLRAPNTSRALELAIRELDRLRAAGHSPTAVLEQSTTRGWRGVFPIHQPNGANKGSPANGGRHVQQRETYAQRLTRKAIAEELASRNSDGAIGSDDAESVDPNVRLLLGAVVQSVRRGVH